MTNDNLSTSRADPPSEGTPIYTFSKRAMATQFQLALWGRPEVYMEAVAEEVFEEIDRLERQLSLYQERSDVSELNAGAAYRAIPVDPRLMKLLLRARELSEFAEGAFDITVAPLMRAWGFMGASGKPPDPLEVEAARTKVGMNLLELDEENMTVRFLHAGVMLDFGAIGKGYAIEEAGNILREYGFGDERGGGLLHGGTSTVVAIGGQPDGSAWPIAIQDPTDASRHLAVVSLRDNALSVSAVHGKYFTDGDARYGHVIDPRTGLPVQNALLAAVVCPSATESDALSTALLALGEPFLLRLAERPETGALVALPDQEKGMRVIDQLRL